MKFRISTVELVLFPLYVCERQLFMVAWPGNPGLTQFI